jgi:ectoine hydroxylase-related dioxygenase (phytanoyl-CoA dioxygenase family)
VRDLLGHPTVVTFLHHQLLGDYLWSLVGRDLVAVKATLFDKTHETNWRVQWHQDRSIAVRERRDMPGYGGWGTKGGALHADAPSHVLSQMLAVRIHLDECGPENGPLRVVPGTHTLGKLSSEQVASLVAGNSVEELCVSRGAMLLMRPLLVHSSAVASAPVHRRILHIEFAPADAISPLHWHSSVTLRRRAA